MAKTDLSVVVLNSTVFLVTFWLMHYYHVCWLGFFFNQLHSVYPTSIASYSFFAVVAYLVSSISWWPEKLSDPPKGIFNIIYKLWIAVLLYDFAEWLLWFPWFEAILYVLEVGAELSEWLVKKAGNTKFKTCFDLLGGYCIHHLVLGIIFLYPLYTFAINSCVVVTDKRISNSKKECPDETIPDSNKNKLQKKSLLVRKVEPENPYEILLSLVNPLWPV